ncbi:hypothetical protein CMV_016702 [Castanea mollissima]|uniref:Uncharacterized protein n=1 Tax=Castanea mollissima TaxID=60419 RepID=A0A8J4R3G6_9ROSI|nr:hypothetical protein CMV_016702 [Castanea mollissima]
MRVITWNRSFRGLPNVDDGKDDFDEVKNWCAGEICAGEIGGRCMWPPSILPPKTKLRRLRRRFEKFEEKERGCPV